MKNVQGLFPGRDELHRGLAALKKVGVAEHQIEIRRASSIADEADFGAPSDDGRAAQVRMTKDVNATMAATGGNLVGAPVVPTTDSSLGDLLAQVASREKGKGRDRDETETGYEIVVRTDDPEAAIRILAQHGAHIADKGDPGTKS